MAIVLRHHKGTRKTRLLGNRLESLPKLPSTLPLAQNKRQCYALVVCGRFLVAMKKSKPSLVTRGAALDSVQRRAARAVKFRPDGRV
jgi:hypothetical protein